MGPHYLNHLFSPQSVAVIGASERPGAVGTVVFRNLLEDGFKGQLFPVNPKHPEVLNKKSYRQIGDIGQKVDLVIIATPAQTIPEIIRQCGEAGVHAAVVLSAGFSETGDNGKKLQSELINYARHYGIRIVGPNCLGIMRPNLGLNATFSKNIARPGQLALVSQSGALCTAMLDWAQEHNIGFSTMVSLGDAADVDFGDILGYLALDRNTQSILLYVEGIHNARSFMSSLRIAARMKPVVIIKSGRYESGTHAAITHTGAMVGRDDVFHAAISRAGTVRVYTIEQLFSAAQLLGSGNYRARGNRLAIITNGGGLGVMAADRAVEQDVILPQLDELTMATLNQFLPYQWSHNNPVDILGDADAERYRKSVTACLQAKNIDGVLVMLAPQAMTACTESANAVIEAAREIDKPLLTCWMGGKQVADANSLFINNKIANFHTPETSVEAFSYLASYRRNQELLMQVPEPLEKHSEPDIDGAHLIIEEALSEKRKSLSNLETMAVLKAFGIPVVTIMEAETANEALVIAESLGFPVAMKINSPDIMHKSDVLGVRLNVNNAATVRTMFRELVATAKQKRPDANIKGVTIENMYQRANGRELMIGVIRDPVFGPGISVGAGGTMVEVMRDSVVSLPPLNRLIAQRMLAGMRASRLLGEFRNMPAVNIAELENVLLRVSELVCEIPDIIEMDINPLIADEQGVLVVDARMTIDYPPPKARQYSHMAIHPYPSHLASRWQLPDGTNVIIRPIRPEDAKIEYEFVQRLSPQSKYFRFMRAVHELTPEMLVRFTQIDYDLEMALIAVLQKNGEETEVGVARYVTNPDGRDCEFAIVISDEWHNKGLAFRMMEQLMEIARSRGLTVMEGEVLTENKEMLNLAKTLGFETRIVPDDLSITWISRHL